MAIPMLLATIVNINVLLFLIVLFCSEQIVITLPSTSHLMAASLKELDPHIVVPQGVVQ